jgi:uncharacterized protein
MTPPTARYPGRAPIDAYGGGGFRFAGMSHRGSILCLPDAITAWDVQTAAALTPASFDLVFAHQDRVRVLLLGTGRAQVFPNDGVRAALGEAGIAVEAMSTGAACRTYNVLLGEGRPVAAALVAVD